MAILDGGTLPEAVREILGEVEEVDEDGEDPWAPAGSAFRSVLGVVFFPWWLSTLLATLTLLLERRRLSGLDCCAAHELAVCFLSFVVLVSRTMSGLLGLLEATSGDTLPRLLLADLVAEDLDQRDCNICIDNI
jgi:hypothetical protein